MIRIEHVNLVVNSLDDTLRFLETALPEWHVRGRGDGEWYGAKRRWLHFGTDSFYITINDRASGPGRDLRGMTPGLAHVGIEVDSVDAVRNRLLSGGFAIATIGPEHPHRKSVYFTEPSGTEFEFIEYLSEAPAERNLYGGETSAMIRVSTA